MVKIGAELPKLSQKYVKFAGPLAPATASASAASTLRASAEGAPVTSGSRLSDMAPCLVVEETDPFQISNVTAGSRGNLPLARKTPAKYFFTTSKRNGGKIL